MTRFGPFVIEERIAVGGTAEIFRAHRQNNPGEPLAIKRLLPALAKDAEARQMLADEGLLHARIEHPNVVRCLGAGNVDGEPYIALEIIDGPDLHRVLRAAQSRGRTIAPTVACSIARALLSALSAVHDAKGVDGTPLGIVHRDVSPSNVFLAERGAVKLGDFGIAYATTGRGLRTASLGRGKLAYLSPEQVASEPVDRRADLFAVGSVLAEMLLGRPLFFGSGQLAILLAIRDGRIEALDAGPKLAGPLDATLRKALARRPADRFATAEAFAEALLPFAWHDEEQAQREIATLIRWTKETSQERAAIRLTPSSEEIRASRPTPTSAPPPTAPDANNATPMVDVPQVPVAPALTFDFDAMEPPPSSIPRPAGNGQTTAPFAQAPSFVRRPDGKLLGPYGYAKLVELIATGQLEEGDEIDFSGAGFRPLIAIDSLARHLAPRSSVTAKLDGPGTPALTLDAGPSDDASVGIAKALIWIGRRQSTGLLLATRTERRKEIYVQRGRLWHVASTDAGELLGELLVSRGLLAREELDLALAVLPRFGGRLGEALGALGLIDPVRIFREIQSQGRDRVSEVFRWRSGELSFYEGATPSKVDFPLDLPLGQLFESGAAALFDHERLEREVGGVKLEVMAVDDAMLRDLGWSPLAMRALTLARFPVNAEALLTKLHREGHRRHPSQLALAALRLAGLLRVLPS